MKLHFNLFIATAVVVLFTANSAQANISSALQSVCNQTGEAELTSKSTVSLSTNSGRNKYRSKLAAHFDATNCFGKKLIETDKDQLVNKTNLSETNNTLAVAPN